MSAHTQGVLILWLKCAKNIIFVSERLAFLGICGIVCLLYERALSTPASRGDSTCLEKQGWKELCSKACVGTLGFEKSPKICLPPYQLTGGKHSRIGLGAKILTSLESVAVEKVGGVLAHTAAVWGYASPSRPARVIAWCPGSAPRVAAV